MRILHVVPTYLPATRYGGPIVAVHSLCRALAARGHAVEVFTTSIDGPDDTAVPHDRPIVLDGVTVRYFASRRLRRLAYAPALMQSLRGEIAGADVVHLHSAFLWPTWRAARLSHKRRIPYVVSPRGMVVKKLIASRHRLIKSAWIALIERANLEQASAIHATSAIEAAEIKKFGWRLPPIAVVPNGVDAIDETARRDAPSADIAALAAHQPLVLFFGRLARVKGLDRLLRAFAGTRRGTLAIVGNDYEGLLPELSELVRYLKIDDRVRIVPRAISEADKQSMYAAARVFVLPSYSESFGNVVLEAMQHGVPVIVTPEVGAADVVKESGGGLVADGDAPSLGAAIDRLTEDVAGSAAMGQAGRAHVRERYGWPSVAARMEALYDDLQAAH
ncbi:MAG TPA: glycosyltransferase [Xanthobacteraceae bacterium]|jgi:glycosyltransferase involved in cell wall biosynthesis|nr:glycosyltransferase [Xanthobacteraceae bacterium]